MGHILVIDDDPRIRLLIRRILEKDGHMIDEAGDGASGVESHRRNGYQLVITDIIMPDQEGVETIRILKREFPGLPVIAMSGGGGTDLDYLGLARKLGADAILHKPFPNQEISEAVTRLLPED